MKKMHVVCTWRSSHRQQDTVICLTCIRRRWGERAPLRQPHSLGGGPGMRPRPGKALRGSKTVKSDQHSTEAETLWWCSCSNSPDVYQNPPWPGKWSHCWVKGPGWLQPWKLSYSCILKTGMGRQAQLSVGATSKAHARFIFSSTLVQ